MQDTTRRKLFVTKHNVELSALLIGGYFVQVRFASVAIFHSLGPDSLPTAITCAYSVEAAKSHALCHSKTIHKTMCA